ncbi:F-box protein SKIP14-like [Andrographis paniculata]|uniref:F-box protein SKIP14-like n=1 Tax=Andrographis paniculata TaxID=175694 RepID=UPI0021E8D4B2|nr:F-box protein SKIP14-like [Andrographis paniculata]
MALNYSHMPMFQPYISEDNLVSPMRIVNGYLFEGVPDMNGEGCLRPWYLGQGDTEEHDLFCRRDKADFCSLQDSTSVDIVDRLPSDPFGMDMQSTFTAITGWLEDLEVDYEECMMADNGTTGQGGNVLFDGWHLLWVDPVLFQPFRSTIPVTEQGNRDFHFADIQACDQLHTCNNYMSSSVELSEKQNTTSRVEEVGMGFVFAPHDIRFEQASNVGDVVDFSIGTASCSSEMVAEEKIGSAASVEETLHEGFFLALSYLGVKDLLSVGMACKSLFSTVRGDPLLWRTIHIDLPLNERITDDVLVQLASRAQGNLQCLSLVECLKITEDVLRHILEINEGLTKLRLFGCTRISIDWIVKNIRAFNSSKSNGGIKHLRIGGIFGVDHEHFQELEFLLGANKKKLESDHKKSHFFRRDNLYLPYDDERVLDLEICPLCKKVRLVYDCPVEGCSKILDESLVVCRACSLCIARCTECGRCIDDVEFEENFCLELLCSDCYKYSQKQ